MTGPGPEAADDVGAFGVLSARVRDLRDAYALLGDDTDSAGGRVAAAALKELDFALDELRASQLQLAEVSRRSARGRGGSPQDSRLLRGIFQDVPTPILVLEGEGVIRRLNPAAARLLRCPQGYATGRPLTAFLPPVERPALRSHLAAAARSAEPSSCAVTVAREGTVRTVELVVQKMRMAPGGRPLLLAAATGADAAVAEEDAPAARLPGPEHATSDRAVRDRLERLEVATRFARLLLAAPRGFEGDAHPDGEPSPDARIGAAAGLLTEGFADWALL
ncbi:MAG: PAS domain-containing protein, partial [Streptomycetaceae bacterium]|nr:PAS domain-containing protein [Streptomycetaceae bacterium]